MSPKKTAPTKGPKAKAAKQAAEPTNRRKSSKQPDESEKANSEGENNNNETVELAMPSAPSQPDSEVTAREQSALLNSLKYQLQSKKASEQHRKLAETLLQEYQGASRERKWEILADLKTRGLKNLSWYHETAESMVKRESTSSSCQEAMCTASRILEINGLKARDLTPGEQEVTLNDLLTESEGLYGHKRNVVAHPSNPLLHRYLYKWTTGKKHDDTHFKEDRVTSTSEMTNKKLGLMLSDERPAATPEATEGYKKFTTFNNQLKKKKMALSKALDNFDELVLFLPKPGSDNSELGGRVEALNAAAKEAREKLNEARVAIANGSQAGFFLISICVFCFCSYLCLTTGEEDG